MYGYIYITTNLINGKKYIGKKTAKTFDPKYLGSGIEITAAVKQYGKENFKVEILPSINGIKTICDDIYELCASEKYYIDFYNCVNDDNYYNLAPGGGWWLDGGTFKRSNQFKTTISEKNKDKKAMHKDGISTWVFKEDIDEYLANGWILGMKDRLEKPKKDKNEPRKGIYKDNIYKVVLISELDQYLDNGWTLGSIYKKLPWNTGLKMPEEYKQKLHFAHLGEKHSKESYARQGEKLKGKIIISNGITRKYIDKVELEEYTKNGWTTTLEHTDKRSKPVCCFETDEIFDTITKAMAAHPECPTIKRCVHSGAKGIYSCTSNGLHWYYVDNDEHKQWLISNVKK